MDSSTKVRLLNRFRSKLSMCSLCACDDLFLQYSAENSRSEKKERLPHPFRYTTKRKDKSYLRKSKGEPTQHLSSAAFLDEIRSYLRTASRADCCVSKCQLVTEKRYAGRFTQESNLQSSNEKNIATPPRWRSMISFRQAVQTQVV